MNGQQEFDWRAGSPDTSRNAALDNRPRRSAHQQATLDALAKVGEHGATDFELAALTGLQQTSVGKRRLELVRQGLVDARLVIDPETLGLIHDRRPTPSGATSLVWVLAEFTRHPSGVTS
jgi:hypothetical protein